MNLQQPTKVSYRYDKKMALMHYLILLVISAMKTEKGLALQDLLTGAYEYVETIDFKPQARIYLLDYLATTEYVSFSKIPFGSKGSAAFNDTDIDCQRGQVKRYN
jgi:hypothetical protein